MDSNTTSITCEYRANYTCWKESADEFNRKWANLMIPVEIMMCLFMIVGTLGNVLVLVVYSYRRHKTTANIFIMYLAGIDLTACVVLHPYIIFKLFNNYDQTWTGACKCFEYFIHCSLTLSGFMLFLVAVDRYLAICRPVKFLVFDKHVVKLIASMTVASVIISLPILEFYGATPEVSEFSSSFTGYKCHLRKQYQNSALLTSFGAFIMCGFLFEIILLAGLYKNVAVTAYWSRRVVPALSNAHVLAGINPSSSNTDTQTTFLNRGPNSSGISSLYAQQNPQQNGPSFDGAFHNRNRENNAHLFSFKSNVDHASSSKVIFQSKHVNRTVSERTCNVTENRNFSSRLKAAKILFFVTAVFFLSWMPFLIMRICYTLNPSYWSDLSETRYLIENLLNHVFYLNNAANPIIYTVINKNFRLDCRNLFRKHCRPKRVFDLR